MLRKHLPKKLQSLLFWTTSQPSFLLDTFNMVLPIIYLFILLPYDILNQFSFKSKYIYIYIYIYIKIEVKPIFQYLSNLVKFPFTHYIISIIQSQ
jgi:hypothetical protein